MDNEENSTFGTTSEEATNKARAGMVKAKSDLKVLQAQLKAEQKARAKAEKALSDAQDTLSVVETDLEQERQDRLKAEQELASLQKLLDTTRVQVEEHQQALARTENEKGEIEKALESAGRKNPMPPHSLPEAHIGGQRVSFLLRLVVDDDGQAMRTEIEHAQSGKKDAFPSFQMQRLADFITSVINPEKEPAPPAQPAAQAKRKPGTAGSEEALVMRNIDVACTNERGQQGIIFGEFKPVFISTRFSVDKIESLPASRQNVPYEVNLFAERVDQKSNARVITASGRLENGSREYAARQKLTGLSAGIYQLTIIVKLLTEPGIVKIVQGPFLQIIRS